MNLKEIRQQIFRGVSEANFGEVKEGIDLLIAEIERLKTKCNSLIDALDQADGLSYHPELADRE